MESHHHERLHTGVGCNVKSAVHSGRRLDQHLQRQVVSASSVEGSGGALNILHRLHLGHHQVHQATGGTARNVGHVGIKRGVVHRVDPHRNACVRCCGERQLGDQRGVFRLAAHRGTILAIEGDVEDAGAVFLRHLGLQLQAFAHPHLDAAVMVADRQLHAAGLCAHQDVARMLGHVSGPIRAGGPRQLARRSALSGSCRCKTG
jgi:hypothetical protein